jgi:hypothetical protein
MQLLEQSKAFKKLTGKRSNYSFTMEGKLEPSKILMKDTSLIALYYSIPRKYSKQKLPLHVL